MSTKTDRASVEKVASQFREEGTDYNADHETADLLLALLAERDAYKVDAERWRELRGLVMDESRYSVWLDGERLTLLELQRLDAHVDAALAARTIEAEK